MKIAGTLILLLSLITALPPTVAAPPTTAPAGGSIRMTETFDLVAPTPTKGTCMAELMRTTDPEAGTSAIAISLLHLESKASGVIGEDEIAVLAKGLDYLKANRQKLVDAATTLTEVECRTRGGIGAGFRVEGGSKQVVEFIILGDEMVDVKSLDELQKTVKAALSKVAELRK